MPEVTLLQQVERSQLQGHHVQHSDRQHLLLIDGAVVPARPDPTDEPPARQALAVWPGYSLSQQLRVSAAFQV